ncbi:uncharacterized protein (DUF2236 family) [Nocardioides daedukensis]|uniref:Uncharacterized protein (DUF2236 family) n=1 Tax=Nocardioides daedukensis TaxID=634462 RepID=A0A7Y9S1E2_9ACTN|nr:oxygenase MpaB family protein [Nocardioides daedukensis]NYG60130.1 uncharacterized protein (DUF2236 family) [Nocardioides daedukensis]
MSEATTDGYFPPGSLLRHVQEQRQVGQTYGQRALIIGATHPVPYVGTSDSTRAKEKPFQRLSSTAAAFETIFFGSRKQADRVLHGVHSMHTRVSGELARDEGNYPKGTPYDAFDPELMLWTMAMLADSSRVCFETLVRPLDADEREELWAEWVRFGELFGMPRSVAPSSAREFDEWLAARLEPSQLHLTEEARVVGLAIAEDMPVPRHMRVGIVGTNLVVRGTLPAQVRELYAMSWTPAHEAAFRAVTAGVRATRHVVPRRVRVGDNSVLFGIVAATERDILAKGGHTMDLPS